MKAEGGLKEGDGGVATERSEWIGVTMVKIHDMLERMCLCEA